MSRIGRNYPEVGVCTEMLVSEHNVRFIAVNSGMDSSNQLSEARFQVLSDDYEQEQADLEPGLKYRKKKYRIKKIKRRMLIGLSDRRRNACIWKS